MDFTPVITLLLAQLWYLLPLLLIATLIKTPWFKGMVGNGFSISRSGYFSTSETTDYSRT